MEPGWFGKLIIAARPFFLGRYCMLDRRLGSVWPVGEAFPKTSDVQFASWFLASDFLTREAWHQHMVCHAPVTTLTLKNGAR